ncbi:hypothetical protein HCA00_14275 [Listeria booriae]|uniref:SdrD B-like domain-containing protein n=1 Tax=Listeria booriae TaxID=1552123 RepID=UPI001625E129|nr:SdrD B-like domain-containing protein [Listeria booriae]MBC1649621.1 hypothetical protein [Listeria booriae]MBC6129978.1 hypothetical protein [Listeria booriae]MBC6305324.1 hypothetical protein [Listeria booriae]
MNKNELVKKWGSGLLAGTLIIGSLAPIAQPYRASAAENTIQQVAAAGQGSVSDTMFEDLDGDSVQDSGEQGVAGIKVELHNDQGALVATATTGTDGKYTFANLADGTYYLHVDLSTLPTDQKLYTTQGINGADGNSSYFTISGGNAVTGYHFGFYPQQGAIQSFVYIDTNNNNQKDNNESGVSNVHIALYNESGTKVADATSAGDGGYSFTGVKPGKYYAKADIPANYKYQSSTYFGSDGTTGYFTVANEQTVRNELNLGLSTLDNSAVSGVVNNAATGAGISGVNVELHDVQGTLIQTVQTGGDGSYNFTGLEKGNYYTKVVIPTGYNYASGNGYGSDGNSNYIALTGDNTAGNYSINLQKQANATIAGVLNTPSGLGIDGQNVSLYTVDGTLVKTVATDSNGDFRFGSLPEGDYYVKAPIPDGYVFDSSNGFGNDGNSYYVHVESNSYVDSLRLTLAQKVGQIRSTVFNDLNKNGTQEATENGIAGATATLYSASGAVVDTTTTDANGLYKFENIAPNNYYVKVTPPTGYNVLANTAFGSDGVSGYIQVQSQQSITNLNASLVLQATPAEVSSAQWIYNKDGLNRVVNNNDTITIANNYYDSYNNPNVNVQFFNKDGGVVNTTGYTATFSNPGLVTPIYTNSQLLAFVHSEKTGSTLVTVRDANGNVVRTFTIVVTAADVKATDIVLGATSIKTTVNATGKVSATVQPTTATNKTLAYTSNDTSIITVDANGNWVAKKAGTTTITVKTTDGSNITKTIDVTVTDPNAITDVRWNFNKDGVSRPVNTNGILEIPNTYMNQYNTPHVDLQFYNSAGTLVQPKGYTVSFSDPTIAAADFTNPDLIALVHNEKTGSTNVTIRDAQGNVIRSFTFTVTAGAVSATDLTLGASSIAAKVGDTGKINATVSPTNATNKTLSYTPADTSIISVDANGNWTAKKAGTTTIAVKTTDGSNITKTVNVTVTDPNAIASVKWNFNKDGVSRPVNTNGILEIPNTYLNQYNKPHVDLQFYNSAGALVQPKGYTVSFSDPTIASADFTDPNLIALVHNEKAGSTNVTIRDAQGNVIRSFTFTVTAETKTIADRVKSADVELVNLRPNTGSTGTNAYIYPHSADVPAGVTYTIETYNTQTGLLFSNITVGTTDGTYHQVLHNSTNPTAAWGQSGLTIKVYATYQGVKYLVLQGPSTDYYSNQTTHVWKD